MSLLREAALEARALYPELIAPGAPMPTNPPLQERAPYFVAFLAGTPVGCGALRPLNGATAEVRRMYVLQAYRRSGVARALLAHLQRTASTLHYTILRIETGNRQLSALKAKRLVQLHRRPLAVARFEPPRPFATLACGSKPA